MVAVVFVLICNYVHPSMTFVNCYVQVLKPPLCRHASIYSSVLL